jgi:hypothetical protein
LVDLIPDHKRLRAISSLCEIAGGLNLQGKAAWASAGRRGREALGTVVAAGGHTRSRDTLD